MQRKRRVTSIPLFNFRAHMDNFLFQPRNDLVLRKLFDDRAFFDEQAFFVTPGYGDICVFCLSWTIDGASHNGNGNVMMNTFQESFNLRHGAVNIPHCSAAGRTGDKIRYVVL